MPGIDIKIEPWQTLWRQTINQEERAIAKAMLQRYGPDGEKLKADVARLQALTRPAPLVAPPTRKPMTRESFGASWAPKDPATLRASLPNCTLNTGSYVHKKLGGCCDENGFRLSYDSAPRDRLLTARSAVDLVTIARPRSGSVCSDAASGASRDQLRLVSGAPSAAGSLLSRSAARHSRGKALSTASSMLVKQEVEQAVQAEVGKLLAEMT
mmetsp:Transcript_80982/g.127509  ORF Transcript_80982/g.127509 Transcript_80982/m.127509 type:complete len:212 (-) Transcript_80982:2-637(-)|eukprot:CAMPEP_0169247438 /NCGR_PEP_ID=MMETSP1016-20121227/35282_1 /TAXON_ID=342587 /ORGANISM="Karlodinium micrum, Strain CCMP2283" /LENGTH=211 /DNA_ID=CAMNT_0009328113 /DNA_START=40 /DNA_END=675 /DNA_ORIENTATION=+